MFIPFKKIIDELQSSFRGENLAFQEGLPNFRTQTADGSIQIASDRVDFSAGVFAKSLEYVDNQNLNFGLELKTASVVASGINIFVTVRKDLGFGWATLRLNLQCQQLRLGLQNHNPIDAKVLIKAGSASVTQINWDLASTAVTTELIGCNEVAGFDAELKSQIQNFVQQSFAIETLKSIINEKINSALNDKISSEISKLSIAYDVEPEQKHMFDQANNLWVYSTEASEKAFLASDLAALAASTKPTILVKKSTIEEIVKKSLNSFLAKNVVSSRLYAGLSKITCSRFSQFFVWPALKSLPKCFNLQIQNQVEVVQIKNINTLEINLKLSSWAAGEGRNLAYFSSQLLVSPLTESAEVLSLTAKQDHQFTSWSGRSSRISTNLMKSPLQDLLLKTISDLGKNESFSIFKKNAVIKLIGTDTVLVSLN